MPKFEATLKKIKTNPEKINTKTGEIKVPKQVELTLLFDYKDVTDAEFGNISLAQANEDWVDVTLDVKQLLIEYPDQRSGLITPANEGE